MDKSLRTWRLTPNKDSDLWTQSSFRGEVWVRAHDAIEARKLTAQRFRVRQRSSDRRSRMESPWYVRELTRCESEQSPQFDFIEIPGVVFPMPDGMAVSNVVSDATLESTVTDQESETDAVHPNKSARLERVSHDVVALDVRQAIVALLVAKEIDAPGRWLDVYAATATGDKPIYVIIPAPKLRRVIGESIASLIDRTLDEKETSWILHSEDIQKLLGGDGEKLRAA
jgi:hypothetical protein